MIYNRIDGNSYKEEFKKKFENFGEKAPVMLSYAMDDFGVTVVHENTGTSYFYEWDFSINIKSMIHKIKQDLIDNHYPRLKRKVEITRKITPEKQAELISNGMNINEIPDVETVIEEETYRIDKILAMKDEFILVNEKTDEQFNYKMNSSSIFFLKKYRNGEYKNLYEAGEAFFSKSVLLNQLKGKAI